LEIAKTTTFYKMALNKNGIFAWASFILTTLGIALVLLGVLKYRDMAIGFSVVGIGFIAIGWAFNALKGRV
tara:strand:- start:7 stop:219 length:213 start_codon:yes stop_codon:yes gene_type:complete